MGFKSLKSKMLIGSLLLLVSSSSYVQAATYTVKSGDSLYKIGKSFNTSYNTIISDNKLSSTMIYPGQKLYVNAPEHSVKSGDTLFKISKQYGVSLDELRRINNIYTNLIYPGQTILIPKSNAYTPNPVDNSQKPILNYSEGDLDLLARLVTAEAESEPYKAKVAVAAVVLNRVKSSRFPNSINDVIYEKSGGYYQFTPTLNGWINKPASAEAKKAAKEALYGSDPSNGALYYFDDTVTNTWLLSKPDAVTIGKLIFKY
ncbi:LysM peptidoglycan-binding domain-containing protein [Clostridium sp. MSJ-4]|uniref:LysM peptidoglycan-binding domain-containing protein n=1 Tax=Clostridium simiarum TaxID=2841506 RepID=A0ABS6F0P7_9CLOT|nr:MULTISPECIES: LysM peptidoglycan-binding domain-containing protein [Clostridium]MBU5591955.1 LysM peptidoglycan-binding domain-containing protein [Clostridium simiarum]